MPSLPSSLALTSIADGSLIIASDHRNNYSAIQTLCNSLLGILDDGAGGQVLTGAGTTLTWAAAPVNLPYLATFTGQSVSSTGTANTAYYMPIVAAASLAVTSIKFFVGTQSGNYDIGVYDSTFAKVWAKGSTAVPVTGPATVLISAGTPTSLTVTTGVYYLAFAADNGTAAVHVTTGAGAGVSGIAYSKAASFPLPSSLSSGTTPPPDGHGIWAAIV